MFSRRRSRGHYDPAQYNTGIRTPSASAAAANAFYSRQLGSSAAAEAIRRHSMDQSDADAIRDFHPTQAAPSPVPTPQTPGARCANSLRANSLSGATPQRRANSLTSRSHPLASQSPQTQQRFYTPQSSMVGRQPPLRRNSLSSADRSNSLTRTHTVANRDASGRTLSLTTTTVRQMGSFEIVTTKDIPVASPLRNPRAPFHELDAGSSVHSIDSELVGIQEDPEEDADHTPMRSPIRSPAKSPNRLSQVPASPGSASMSSEAHLSSDAHMSSDVSDATPSPPGSPGSLANNLAPPPVPPQSKHRDSSPARSALRQPATAPAGDAAPAKSRVSFGGDKEFVYESYEYEADDATPPATRSPGAAAASAAAAARARQQVMQQHQLQIQQQQQQMQQQQQQIKKTFVMSQPPLAVTKRASEQSLRSKRASAVRPATAVVGSSLPYPQARTWESQNNTSDDELQFVDAPGSSIPPKSIARQQLSQQQPSQQLSQQLSQQQPQQHPQQHPQQQPQQQPQPPHLLIQPHQQAQPQSYDSEEEPANQAQIYAQALALAQEQFNKENAAAKGTITSTANGQPKHYYRSLLTPAGDQYDDDDAMSVGSDSSFTREGQGRAGPGRAAAPSRRMKSLRQPQTPTLRSGQDQGRKGSLLNQARPQVTVAPAPAPPQPQPAGGFRTYSLRQQGRPDPATLFAGPVSNGASDAGSGGGGAAFKSRVADSDSEDEGFSSRRGGGGGSNGGKMTLGDMFSPNTDVKDLFKSRSQSEQLPKTKKSGFFKRMFAKKA